MLTVIIPVRNGGATLERCLKSIQQQDISIPLEIIVLDSESADDSMTIAESYNCRVVTISAPIFNHGLTRNLGVEQARGELIYFTVQDAHLAERDVLSRMAAHFEDRSVMGVVGMQAVPHERDKNPAVWFRRVSLPTVEVRCFPDPQAFRELPPKEKFAHSSWDNVNAMYRKKALERAPFRKTNFSEDWLWAHDALAAGMKIVRDPSLVTYHYHHLSFQYNFRVLYIINYYFKVFFDVLPSLPRCSKSLTSYLKRVRTILIIRKIPLQERYYWILHNFGISVSSGLSILIFRMVFWLGKQKLLDSSYRWFVRKIPQGQLRKK